MKNISVIIALGLFFFTSVCTASDYHQNDQSHRVTYVILDSNGKPVAGETVRLAVQRSKDGYFLDFNDNSFKNSSWTTRLVTMNYDANGEHYYRVVSIDNGGIVSGDYVCIVSNDSATYSDHQAEVVGFDSLGKLVKINR